MVLFAETYYWSSLAVFMLLCLVFIQAVVASVAHRKQGHYIPGIVDPALSHNSFVFRSHRTFMNSLENVPWMIFLILLSTLMGVGAPMVAITAWIYVVGRAIHMVLYYAIATEKNPSPRSYFYMIALVAQVVLLGATAVTFF